MGVGVSVSVGDLPVEQPDGLRSLLRRPSSRSASPASARSRLVARLERLLDEPPPLAAAERFARHLANEFPAVFLFLCDPSIDATNWRAEQAIRPTAARTAAAPAG